MKRLGAAGKARVIDDNVIAKTLRALHIDQRACARYSLQCPRSSGNSRLQQSRGVGGTVKAVRAQSPSSMVPWHIPPGTALESIEAGLRGILRVTAAAVGRPDWQIRSRPVS